MKLGDTFWDPYDIWSLRLFGWLKTKFYGGSVVAKTCVAGIYLADLLFPALLRRLSGCHTHSFAHIDALVVLSAADSNEVSRLARHALDRFQSSSVGEVGRAWGLPFAWYSKNGVYPADTPYITNTPYVMEALCRILRDVDDVGLREQARRCLFETWDFLDSLHVMYESEALLALSYSPIEEPRIVVNANSYAALAYALHAEYGSDERKTAAILNAKRLVAWIVRCQRDDGSWPYYADDLQGNFVDCFHSCFIIKNLIKVSLLIPGHCLGIDDVIEKGRQFILREFPDPVSGLCRRFFTKDFRDPFKWDIYDQAEFVGLLTDMGKLEDARRLLMCTKERFFRRGAWFCRIDAIGRPWGEGYMRWGIAPLLYQQARLDNLSKGVS